jgi:hypothetical protein
VKPLSEVGCTAVSGSRELLDFFDLRVFLLLGSLQITSYTRVDDFFLFNKRSSRRTVESAGRQLSSSNAAIFQLSSCRPSIGDSFSFYLRKLLLQPDCADAPRGMHAVQRAQWWIAETLVANSCA